MADEEKRATSERYTKVISRQPMSIAAAAAISMLFAWNVPAQAAEIGVRVSPMGRLEFTIDGPIMPGEGGFPGDDVRLARLLNAVSGDVYIILNSPGGHLSTALEMGRVLRQRQAWTVISGSTRCASACVWLWLGGQKRSKASGERLGIHDISLLGGDLERVPERERHAVKSRVFDELKRYVADVSLTADEKLALSSLVQSLTMVPAREVLWVSDEWVKFNRIADVY